MNFVTSIFLLIALSALTSHPALSRTSTPPRTPTAPITLPEPEPVFDSAPTEAIAFGDFNNDGFQDIAMGMPSYGSTDSGAVRVLFGAASGFSESSSRLLTTFCDSGSRCGAALAVGDDNGDGYDDLYIGAPGDGLVQLIVQYGSLSGGFESAYGYGNSSRPRLGAAVAVGDFDCDGVDDDWAASSPEGQDWFNREVLGNPYGTVWVSTSTPNWGLEYELGRGALGFGTSLVAGDFNGDGCDDIAVGSPQEVTDSITTRIPAFPWMTSPFMYPNTSTTIRLMPESSISWWAPTGMAWRRGRVTGSGTTWMWAR